MKRFNIFEPLYLSFYSKEVYQDVAKNWTGIGASYLLLLVFLLSVVSSIKMQSNINTLIDEDAPAIVSQLPTIKISEGELSIDKDVPYYIRNVETNNVLLVIDTSGQINSIQETSAIFFASQNRIQSRDPDNPGDLRTILIDQKWDTVIDQTKVITWLDKVKRLAFYPLVVFFTLFGFLIVQIRVLLLSVIALIFNNMIKAGLHYSALLRLSAIAITPLMVVKALLMVMGVFFPLQGLLLLVLAVGYLYFGIKAVGA